MRNQYPDGFYHFWDVQNGFALHVAYGASDNGPVVDKVTLTDKSNDNHFFFDASGRSRGANTWGDQNVLTKDNRTKMRDQLEENLFGVLRAAKQPQQQHLFYDADEIAVVKTILENCGYKNV